jgi:hypothetical protein
MYGIPVFVVPAPVPVLSMDPTDHAELPVDATGHAASPVSKGVVSTTLDPKVVGELEAMPVAK